MITIFNRKEVFTTYSLKEQADIRNILNGHNINYVVNISGTSVRNIRAGPIAVDQFGQKNNCQYRIFVHKKNFDEAVFAIRSDYHR